MSLSASSINWKFDDVSEELIFYSDGESVETFPYEEIEAFAQVASYAFVEDIPVSVGDIELDDLILIKVLSEALDKLYRVSIVN